VDAATAVISTTAEMPATAVTTVKARKSLSEGTAAKKGRQQQYFQQNENNQKQGRKQQQDSRDSNSSISLATPGSTAVTKTIQKSRTSATARHMQQQACLGKPIMPATSVTPATAVKSATAETLTTAMMPLICRYLFLGKRMNGSLFVHAVLDCMRKPQG
jgi:hypothetical protein